jgi:subtilisin-like proprotein convertase family protein
MKARSICLLALIPLAASAFAQAITTEYSSPNLDASIPDNSLVGVPSVLNVAGGIGRITDINVRIEITGANARTGDYYAYLQHDSGFAVLLNRVGRTSENALGYGDAGMSITLDDQATEDDGETVKDVHSYRTSMFGNDDIALDGPLTGTWAADGRGISYSEALDSSPRDAALDGFDGLSPNGDWTLFVADVSPTGTGRLESWSIVVSTAAVPEPTEWAAVAGCALLGWGFWRRFYRRHDD